MESLQSVWYSPTGSKLRRMFYLVTPNETSFEHHELVPEYVEESASVFMTFQLVEGIISMLYGDGKVRISDGLTSASAGILSRIPLIFVKSVFLTIYQWIYNNYHLVNLEWSSPYTWFLAFLSIDFFYYWFHRLSHETNILWSAHQVHHSSEDYNFTTALRQSIVQVYCGWLFYTPMALFLPVSIYMVHEQLNLLYQFWIHTEYIRSLGPLEYILNTPSHHRVHHGRNPYCIDKNYGGSLIIWDRIFGTFEAEKEEVIFGLVTPVNTFEPFKLQVCYWKNIWKKWQQSGSLWSALFNGPGWIPGQPEDSKIPEIEYPVQRYTTQVSNWCSVYALLHFTAITYFFLMVLTAKHLMPQESILAVLIFIIYSLSCFGNIFDQSSYAACMEFFRCGSVLCISQFTNNFQFLTDINEDIIATVIPWFYGISTLLWILPLVSGTSKQQLKDDQKKD